MPSTARLAWLAKEWREGTAEDGTVQTAFLLSVQTVEPSLLVDQADAEAEATRRQALRGVKRDPFEVVLFLDEAPVGMDIGKQITLFNDRYGLVAGKKFVILGVKQDAEARELTLIVWG